MKREEIVGHINSLSLRWIEHVEKWKKKEEIIERRTRWIHDTDKKMKIRWKDLS